MPLPADLPVVDHHAHLSPQGEGVDAARRFARAGGTHLFLATQQYGSGPPLALDDYRNQFETTGSLADRIRAETGVGVYVVVAPYPVDLVTAAPRLGIAGALALQLDALELAGRWIRERRAVALGEVGLPHFAVSAEIGAACDRAFDAALAVAHDVGCPAVVHSADLDPRGYADLAERGRRAGLPPGRIVKHYARARTLERAGIVPSYLARREIVRDVRADPAPWFLETDFLDDPARPGAVLDLTTVPRRAEAALRADPSAAEWLRRPFDSSIEQVYGWRPQVDRRPP